ncbi:auxin-responsive protein IAA20-like [Lolium perenne]|uniref:auxin-responsive protein IAA20-like n=1 Tax=Lolium perenne TaxID=4522 RepID=UPI0021F63F6D|nr:auxin-responsive protein IAA20-like [Lolium perenne]
MELELGLAPPNHAHPAAASCGKRAWTDPFGAPKATLPLSLRDDDDINDRIGGGGGGEHGAGACEWEMCNGKRKLVVGWPPVRSARRRGHVKVSMEGAPIGRKVDLSLHGSYHQLLRTLRLMFPPSPSARQGHQSANDRDDRRRRGRGPFAVTYEDGDGDWLLVGDVPWEDFARSAKRLRILV